MGEKHIFSRSMVLHCFVFIEAYDFIIRKHSELRKNNGYRCLSCNEKFKDLISLNLHEQHEHFDLLQEIDIEKVTLQKIVREIYFFSRPMAL